MAKKQPNIVLIMCDQLRWDALGFVGNLVVKTPHLDQLAASGTVCTNAYTAVPSCIASRAALLTGMSQRNHGRTGYEDGVPFTYKHTLPGTLAAAGYHTQAVGKNHFYPARNLCGYHNTVLMDGYLEAERRAGKDYSYVDDYVQDLKKAEGVDADMVFHGVDCNSYLSRPWPYNESLHPTSWVTTKAVDFLRRKDPTKPYFLKVSYLAPHPPYVPPQAFLDMYANVEMPPPVYGDWFDTKEPLIDVNGACGRLSSEELTRLKKAYYAMVTHVDYQIGRLMMHLKAGGELDNTVILFTSDHGEMLGDHNLFRKALPCNGSARVPLFVTLGSEVLPPPQVKQIDKIVELRDIMPTLLDIAGVSIPSSVDGNSLLPLIKTHAKKQGSKQQRGQDGLWRTYLHGEHRYGAFSHHYMVTEQEKYVWFSQTDEELFFDLAKDPNELHNIATQAPDRVEKLRKLLQAELRDRPEGYVQDGRLQVGITPLSTQPFLRDSLQHQHTQAKG